MDDLERLTNQYSGYKFGAQFAAYFPEKHLVCGSLDDLRERQIPEGTYCMVIGDVAEHPVIRLDGFLLGECIAYENRKFYLVVIKNQDHRVSLLLNSHNPMAVQGISLSLICNDSPLYVGFLRAAIDHYREALVDFDYEICVAFFGTPPILEGVRIARYPTESFHMSFARNRSMELCSKSHILMTDLDCYLSRMQVGELVDHLPQTNGVLNFRKPVHPFPGNGLWLGDSDKLRENGYCESFEFFYYEDTEFLMNFSRINIVPHSWFVDFEYVDHSRKRGHSFWHNRDLFVAILKQGGRPLNQHEELTQMYSTWGNKLLQHTDRLAEIQNDRRFRPITVQLCPTEVCDSDCPFCSVAGRPIKSRMSWETVEQVLTDFASLGAKAVEITGGGNPMLYSHSGHDINDIVILASNLGLDVGIITNSHNLKRLRPEVHPAINWVRISLIQLHEGQAPEDYDFAGFPEDKMGFSYIIYDGRNGPDVMSRTGKTYEGTTVDTIKQIARLVELHPQVKFVRLAGDCLVQGDNKRVATNWRPVIDEIDRWGKFFLKEIGDRDVPFDDACYVGLLRPYVACNPKGDAYPYQVYICSSYVLTMRTYDTEYSMCDVADIIPAWERMNKQFAETGTPYEVRGNGGTGWCGTCEHCFYANNNHLIHTVVTELPDRNFA